MENLLQRSSKVYKHPKILLIVAGALTLFFGAGIPFLQFDNNIRTMLPKHNKDLAVHDYYEDENRFGNSALVFIGVESSDAFSDKSLAYLKGLQTALEDLNKHIPVENVGKVLSLSPQDAEHFIAVVREMGITEQNVEKDLIPLLKDPALVRDKFSFSEAVSNQLSKTAAKIEPALLYTNLETPINKVEGLLNADSIANENDSLTVRKLIDSSAIQLNSDGSTSIDSGAVVQLKKRVAAWDIYKDVLVSEDGKLTTVIVKLNTHDIGVKSSLNKAILTILSEKKADGIKTYLDGEPVIEDMIARYMMDDIKILLPLVVLVVLLILYFCFRNLQGVLYPSVVVLMGVVWAVGAMAYLGVPVTVVGTAMPVLLVAIASAYGIHQMNHYFLDPGQDKHEILKHNMKTVGLAILLSGITVMVGFGALVVEDFVPVKNFGLFTALGDLVAVAAALYILPALILIGQKPKSIEYHESTKGLVGSILKLFVRINKKHSRAVLVVSLVLTAVFAVGTLWVKAELNNASLFKADDPVRLADDKLNEKLAGTQVMNVVLDTDLSDPTTRTEKGEEGDAVALTTPAVLGKIEDFSVAVQKGFPFVKKTLSFNTMLKKMNQEMNGGDSAFYKIPESPELISQYLLIFSGDLQSVLSSNHDKLRISITMKRTSTEESEMVAQFARKYFDNDFQKANHLQVQITGAAHLYYVGNTLLLEGTSKSVIVCVVIVFALLIFVLKDFWISLIAMVPIFMTLVINFGMLGLFNIPLNAGTAMVSSVAIGIGVDYSIHYITWYRSEMRKRRDVFAALENTILHKGRAILYNMLVIVGGFLVMIVSKFVPLIQFGILVSVCMLTTAIGALVVVPAMMHVLAKRKARFLYLDEKKSDAA